MPTTEQELRTALTGHVDDEIAAHDDAAFRAELFQALVVPAATADTPTPPSAPQVFDLVRPAPRAPRRRRLGLLAAAAACVALGAAGIAALRGSDGDHGVPAARVPASVRSAFLPGTRYVGTFTGTGTSTVYLPARTLPNNYEWMTFFSCTGNTTQFHIGDSGSEANGNICGDDPGTTALTPAPVHGTWRVSVAASVRWRIWVVLSPEARTNGSYGPIVQSPLSAARQGTPNYLAGRGDGVLAAHLADGSVEVHLSCAGSGVSISGYRTQSAPAGDTTAPYTHTCFRGYEYVWTSEDNRSETITLHIHAAATTSWRIVVTN